MRQRRDAALRSLKWMLVASVALPVLLFGYVGSTTYHTAFELADERIDRSLDIAAEQALRIFQSIGVTFDSVEQITRGRTDRSIKLNEAELSERLKQFVAALPGIGSIWILDENSDALVSSLFFPIPAAFNAPDRAHLKAFLAPDANIHIGEVVRIEATGKLIFPVSKWRFDSSGTFSGMTEISVSPLAFERFYEQLAARSSASFTLFREDGAVLARYPVSAASGLKLDATSGFAQMIAQNPNGGRYTAISSIDRVERRIAVRRLNGFPLYVTSSLQTGDIRGEWLSYMAGHLVFGIPATLLLVALILLAMRRTAALYAESERREALEASLRQSQKMEAVGQLTGGVAHDFNNLLTIILGNLQMAQRREVEGKTWTLMSNAYQAAERAAELTKRLLAFSRSQPLDPRPLDANRLVGGMSDLLDRTLGETVAVETVGSAGLWLTEADGPQLEAAILNLAINARDAMPEGGKVTIETANVFLDEFYCRSAEGVKPGQYVMISVSDTGSGMAQDVVDKAFDPFFTTKAAGAGTGLGRSQVYGFIRQSGGHVRIYSEVGEGTTVKLYLPRSFARENPRAGVRSVDETPKGNRETVLVVEDDPDVRGYVVETLTGLDYQVRDAANAEQALKILDDPAPVDLLLTDVVMPGMNGRNLAEAARLRRPGLKVLYMTGYSRNAIVHQGRLDAGVALMQKPFSQNVLAARVRTMLEQA